MVTKPEPTTVQVVQRASSVSTSVRATIAHVAEQIDNHDLAAVLYGALFLSEDLEKLLEAAARRLERGEASA